MQIFGTRNNHQTRVDISQSEKLRAIAYSMDTLAPGFYVWFGNYTLRIGGHQPDDQPYRYPGTIHSSMGVAIVLPGYHILSTYKGAYDPKQAPD
jgi:hypothetical protein